MTGINMNKPVFYKHSSLRFFAPNEHHVTRITREHVLLLVYEGVLRFSEDGHETEVRPGEYYIQKKGMHQRGDIASDAPQYLYVHFLGEWSEQNSCLPYSGTFDYTLYKPLMEHLNELSHQNATLTEQSAVFYTILANLFRQVKQEEPTTASRIADYISHNYLKDLSLEEIAAHFSFSKNHIINIFRKAYHMTPFEYINHLKIKQAMSLLEITSLSAEEIAYTCGFSNYSHFYRQFYRMNQLSPSEWRYRRHLM